MSFEDEEQPLVVAEVVGIEDCIDEVYYANTIQEESAVKTASVVLSPDGSEKISPYLCDLIRQADNALNWDAVLAECYESPEEAFYVSWLNGRTPLHEACLSSTNDLQFSMESKSPPPIVIEALLHANESAAHHADEMGNLPLHLFFARTTTDFPTLDSSLRSSSFAQLKTPDGFASMPEEQRHQSLEHLLHASPDAVACSNDAGSTPLHMACDDKMVSADIVQSLLFVNPEAASILDKMGRTPLARYCDANGQNLSVARLLLDAFPGATRSVDRDGRTPLHRSAFEANLNIVETILLRDEGAAGVADSRGQTPLHRACQCISSDPRPVLDVVLLLIQCHPESTSDCDKPYHRTPLHYACKNRHPSFDVIRCVLDINPQVSQMPDSDGKRPIHDACQNHAITDDDGIVAILIHANPEISRVATKKGDTPLHFLAETCGTNPTTSSSTTQSHLQTIDTLLALHPEGTLTQNDYGYTPLHCACRTERPNPDAIAKIITAQPQCVLITSNAGETPLHMASRMPNVPLEVIQSIFTTMFQLANDHNAIHGSSPPTDMLLSLSRSNRTGNNPLHDACFRTARPDIIHTLAQGLPAWIWETDAAGFTPLHLLCKAGTRDLSSVKTLIQISREGSGVHHKQNIASLVDRAGYTPLHSALRIGTSLPVITFLADAASDDVWEQATLGTGDTPLHLACIRDVSTPVLKVLLNRLLASQQRQRQKHNTECNVLERRNHDGYIPLDLFMSKFRASLRHYRGNGRAVEILHDDNDNDDDHDDDNHHHHEDSEEDEDGSSFHRTAEEAVAYNRAAKIILAMEAESDETMLFHASLRIRRRFGMDVVDDEFVRRILQIRSSSVVRKKDRNGELPLHIEAATRSKKSKQQQQQQSPSYLSLPHWKRWWAMSPPPPLCIDILESFPPAACERDPRGNFPLQIMAQAGRTWNTGIRSVLMAYPPALAWQDSVRDDCYPEILSKLNGGRKMEGTNNNSIDVANSLTVVFQLIRSRPYLVRS